MDTGLTSVPETELIECSEYCGLPYEVRPVMLEGCASPLRKRCFGVSPREHNYEA